MWCLPPKEDARFVAAMEDVLEVYARPYDSMRPLVCLDEAAKQLLGEVREPLPMKPNQPMRFDCEYHRAGTCALFMLFEPLAARRYVAVRERRTCWDYAQIVKWMCDELYPNAQKIVLVQDNLNTHGPHSLYRAFEPQEARRLIERIEWHFTPRHGSWLNMAELELSILARQCLSDRMGTSHHLQTQLRAWQQTRNQSAAKVNWHFTTHDARIKLKSLYPKLLHG